MSATDDFTDARAAFREAGAAFRGGYYSTAIDRLLEAQSLLAAVPDSRTNAGARIEFGRQLDALMAQAVARERRADAAATSGGIQRSNIEYENPTNDAE
jgi:hypothetical protein